MFRQNELENLRLQKEALIVESHLNRLMLQQEWRNVRSRVALVGQVTRACQGMSPWLLLLAPVAGLLVARSLRKSDSTLGSLLSVLKWVQPVHSLWKTIRKPSTGTKTPSN